MARAKHANLPLELPVQLVMELFRDDVTDVLERALQNANSVCKNHCLSTYTPDTRELDALLSSHSLLPSIRALTISCGKSPSAYEIMSPYVGLLEAAFRGRAAAA